MVANIIRNVTIFEDYLLRLVRYLTRDKNVKRHVSLQTDPGNTAWNALWSLCSQMYVGWKMLCSFVYNTIFLYLFIYFYIFISVKAKDINFY